MSDPVVSPVLLPLRASLVETVTSNHAQYRVVIHRREPR